MAIRALTMAALARGTTRIAGLPGGEDVAAALRLASAFAELTQPTPATARVTGCPPSWGTSRFAGRLDVGESGATARFALAALGLCARPGAQVEISARGSLLRRRSDALIDALERSGVTFESREWPLRMTPIGPESTLTLRHPRSSQEASALLIALAAYPDEIELLVEGAVPSRPYLEMTAAMLRRFSVRADREDTPKGERWRLRGPLQAPEDPIAVEPDASLAAAALAAACLSGGEVLAEGVREGGLQADGRIASHLRSFGCRVFDSPRGLVASGHPQRGAELDLSGEPDLAPVLAVVAAAASLVAPQGCTRSTLTGLETLNDKESRRLEVLADALRRAGWNAREAPGRLDIDRHEPASERVACALDPHSDHRMAFAFALLGLVRGAIVVCDPDCVAKTWPSFWSECAALGLRGERRAR